MTKDVTDRARRGEQSGAAAQGKDARLGAALRANLARRKAAARAASAGEVAPGDQVTGDDPQDHMIKPEGGESDT